MLKILSLHLKRKATTMFTVILVMFAGLLCGYLIRKVKISFLNGVILTLIWCLLFLLGYEVGVNPDVVKQFHKLGFEAFLIALFATLGSVFGARILMPPVQQSSDNSKTGNSRFKLSMPDLKNLKGSLIILSFFAAGLLLGIFEFIPKGIFGSEVSFYVLCALMFSVGFSLGHQPDTVKQFRRIHSKALLLPFATIAGTWIGVLITGMFLQHSPAELLAVGSGFGYYSLSGILITQYKGAELGTIALLANIFREIFTLIFAPQMARFFGKLAPIAAGGATTMDTTLPVITRFSGKEYVIIAIFHGFVVDFSVPFLVTFFAKL